jgi:tRNA threonylcarbamoyladenosine biosynthesis protein TsaE
MILEAADAAATEALGARLARVATPGFTVYLSGELGTGKTTFIRGFLRALGHAGAVKSPTYTLVEPYELGAGKVYHFDLYRISAADELEFIGIRDYFTPDAICLVEWPERAADELPRPDMVIKISYQGAGRQLHVEALTQRARDAETVLSNDKAM